MAKYDVLRRYLVSRKEGYWRASMSEIETVLGFKLPDSAKRYPAWWANLSAPSSSQAQSWLTAGWETSDVTPGGKVTFKRVNTGTSLLRSTPSTESTLAVPIKSVRQPQFGMPPDLEDEQVLEAGPPTDWFWEGHVVDAVERHLAETGWVIVSKADTASKARGIDLHAERNGQTLLVEAKGYPSKGYRDSTRVGELKPTTQTSQAQHWYSHALLKGVRLQSKNPSALVALAFPDFPRYRTLFTETETGLRKLGLVMIFAFENGRVEIVGL